MSGRWAVVLPLSEALAAGRLRLQTGVEAYCIAETLWLRGNETTEQIERELSKLPAQQRFTVSPEGRLTRSGGRVPKGMLPAGPWSPLEKWITPRLQTAALAGACEQRMSLQLVRGTSMRTPSLLKTDITKWAAYVTNAPIIRLERLRFAMRADGQILVQGKPLPPISGARSIEENGIAVPCGFVLQPAVGAAVARQVLGLSPDQLAMFAPNGEYECIERAAFVRATRAAARLSLRESAND